MKGIFITLEGGEACGKTTQIQMLKEYFKNKKIDALFTKEPGGMPLTDELRRLILNYEIDPPLEKTELLLYLAARIEDIEKVIKPALEEGKIVIGDRFNDSTIAYQASGRQIMPIDDMINFTENIIDNFTPDLTIYLRLDPQTAFERKKNIDLELDRIEKAGLDFHRRVLEGFDYMAKKEPERFAIIDASKSRDEVFKEILSVIRKKVEI